MSREPGSVNLLWKFVSVDGPNGSVVWYWEASTQAGQLVARSIQTFDMYVDCVHDAESNGYVAPEKRR